ncbi:Wadjet anti-phage system protein JetD domain-containing protein [Streptomyces sp. NPDC017993]|uniref:Wadjet anti-phage system protein JetD domain-containing protein n=1 Tax=Streptomyces sp. NPDC017993 TaxID=3365027 RepID=UPI00378E92C7
MAAPTARRAWTTPVDVTDRLRRRWMRGDFLTALAEQHPFEPLCIPLSGPKPSELARDFDAVRTWVQSWGAAEQQLLRIEHRQVGGRVIGTNNLPHQAWIDHREQLWDLLGVTSTVRRFQTLLASTQVATPELADWITAHPMKVLDLEAHWERLHQTVRWILDYQGPSLYLRQIDVPGVDTKFIEGHRAVLTTLLEHCLPAERIDTDAPRTSFTARFRFLAKPSYARFRLLGDTPVAGFNELSVRVNEFTESPPGITTVFIVENETTYLAFPSVPGSMVVLGGGYAITRLSELRWLQDKRLVYWGDLDTHGFAILDRLRRLLPHTESILMDRSTLMAHRGQWVKESKPAREQLQSLTGEESDLYQSLVDDDFGHGVRLEQERVRFLAVQTALADLHGSSSQPPHEEGWPVLPQE